MGFTHVEITLDPAPRLVLQRAISEELVDASPFGRDQKANSQKQNERLDG
ncbi:hypothetical protein AMST5_00240 [freshwater sediment metagenome]|uniref:Uncharacterized protein n=1 Tax=freshwater sediment metagenome TaxID=556182 RepID=A0AA48LX04_9ZZZZ